MNLRVAALLPAVRNFTGARWRDWLIQLLTSGEADPAFSMNYDRASQELMDVADALADERLLTAFTEGVVLACQLIPPRASTAYALLTLIELIAGLTPHSGKQVLWSLLGGHELRDLEAANAKLEVTAVSSLLCYGADSALVEYATLTASRSQDPNELANCFRVARKSANRTQAFNSFMPLLLRACKTQRDFRRVADEVVALSINYEFRDFRHWLLAQPGELPEIPGQFIEALREEALPYLSAKMPAHGRELSLALEAIRRGLTPVLVANEFRALLSIQPMNLSDTLDFAIDLWAYSRRTLPTQKWHFTATNKMNALRNTVVFYSTDELEDRHAILTTNDGVLLNVLSVALEEDKVWQQELKERVLNLKDPATLDVTPA